MTGLKVLLAIAMLLVTIQSVGAVGIRVGVRGRVAINRVAVRRVQVNRVQRFAQPVFIQAAPVRFLAPQLIIRTQPVFIPQQFNYAPINYGYNPPLQRVIIQNGHGCNDFFR